MINKWYLSNFKSFKAALAIDCAKITVLAGANSSGKSSIIQSILLLKQTLQYGSQNRPILFNGPLLRLGGFQDVCNFDADEKRIEIGLDFDLSSIGNDSLQGPWLRSALRQIGRTETSKPTRFSLHISFVPQGANDLSFSGQSLQANILPNLESVILTVFKTNDSNTEVKEFLKYTRKSDGETTDDVPHSRQFEIDMDETSREEVFRNKYEPSMRGGWVSNFLPTWLLIEHDLGKQKAVEIAEAMMKGSTSLLYDNRYSKELVPDLVVKLVNDWLIKNGSTAIEKSDDDYIVRDIQEAITRHLNSNRTGMLLGSNRVARTVSPEFRQLREEVQTQMLACSQKSMDFEPALPRTFSAIVELLREYFRHGVRYLGPLRDSPRPVYQPEALESNTDVGYRGEHTAAVLELNGRRSIHYRSPPKPDSEENGAFLELTKESSLRDAVIEWLVYLGVADNVVTSDVGVFGNRLQVSTDSAGRLHDLTNVGVGVSQVLPIVVTSLLSPKGSLLIFEQPELHLHPKVQSRLADFFVSLALDGKQVILETHSEYMIDRFRLRIAMSTNDNLRSLFNILFSRKSEGISTLTSVEINEFGAITNWPQDFFEQSQKDVGRIIQAATKKRKLTNYKK